MSDFKAALPRVIKWSVGDNKFNEDGKAPKSLSLFVPLESVHAFAQYLMNLADDASKAKTGKVWDYSTQAEVEVQGVYISAKGREGRDGGAFGNLNPAANAPSAEVSF